MAQLALAEQEKSFAVGLRLGTNLFSNLLDFGNQ
jgi:hypothetical protein